MLVDTQLPAGAGICLVHSALNTRPVITHRGGSRFGVRRHDAALRGGAIAATRLTGCVFTAACT
jgi:hypothetical protein